MRLPELLWLWSTSRADLIRIDPGNIGRRVADVSARNLTGWVVTDLGCSPTYALEFGRITFARPTHNVSSHSRNDIRELCVRPNGLEGPQLG